MQDSIFTISWDNKLTGTKNELMIYGAVDKTTSECYYTCKLNEKGSYVITERNNKWQLANSFPHLDLDLEQEEILSNNLGKIVDVYNNIYNLPELLKLK